MTSSKCGRERTACRKCADGHQTRTQQRCQSLKLPCNRNFQKHSALRANPARLTAPLSFPSRSPLLPQFQGIFVMRKLHFVAQVFNIVCCTLVLFDVFVYGNAAGIIVALVVYPIFLIYMASIIRVLSELAISVLLMPSLLAKQEMGGGGRGGHSVNGGDADLAAYGVSDGHDAGTVV